MNTNLFVAWLHSEKRTLAVYPNVITQKLTLQIH